MEGYRESRRCSGDTYPESYITKYTSIRRYTSPVGRRVGRPFGRAPCDRLSGKLPQHLESSCLLARHWTFSLGRARPGPMPLEKGKTAKVFQTFV